MLLETLIFAFAIYGTFKFISFQIVWALQKLVPNEFPKKFTNRDILFHNISMNISIICWIMLYALRLPK